MAKVRSTDSVNWVNFEATIRAELGIASGQDLALEGALDAARRSADRYMNNPFTSGGDDIDPLPASVRAGLIEYIRSSLAANEIVAGTAGIKTGDLQINFVGGPGFDPNVGLKAARRFWINFRMRWDL